MSKKYLVVLVALMLVLGFSRISFAKINGSPHEVFGWLGNSQAAGGFKTGVCSYCHIPHSASGERLFPQDSTTSEFTKTTMGEVAILCAQCHVGVMTNATISGVADLTAQIFRPLNKKATGEDTTQYDTHPTIYSSATASAVEDTQTTTVSATWPYMTAWYAGGAQADKNIECTSCHNPHDWTDSTGPTDTKNFLRISYYQSAATVGTKNFCSACHPYRDSALRGTANSVPTKNKSTHPVNNIIDTTNANWDGIYLNTAYFATWKYATAGSGSSNGGNAIGDRGPHYGPNQEFICQSCHLAHGAPQSQDGLYTTNTRLIQGPLVGRDNDTVGSIPAYFQAETAFIISANGESNFCEYCHGITPAKNDGVETSAVAGVMAKYSHPVDNYPTDTRDNSTYVYWSNLAGDIYVTAGSGVSGGNNIIPLTIEYPSGYVDYEESGDPIYGSSGVTRGTGQYLTCVSCHDVHGGANNTPILRDGATLQFCEDCHTEGPTPGTSHPVKNYNSQPNCDMVTEDGGTLPNYSKLYLDTSAVAGGELVCRSCHGGSWSGSSGVGPALVHGAPARFLLADYLDFNEICVNCHGYDTRAQDGTYSLANIAARRNAAGGGAGTYKAANPSYWYVEGSYLNWNTTWSAGSAPQWTTTWSDARMSRLGSHYVGKIASVKPLTTDTTWGWLGATWDSAIDHRGVICDSTAWVDTTTWLVRGWTWDSTDGKKQVSSMGYINANSANPVLVCLSCHAIHGAASGDTTGNGPVDDTTENLNWSGELLLATNKDSYMCWKCHVPLGTHPVNSPNISCATVYVTRTDTTINRMDTADPFKVVRYPVKPPANYPYDRMLCESCHSAHSANTRWGAMILEGDTALSGSTGKGWDSTNAAHSGLYNKIPNESTKSIDDRPTCELCHPQGE